MLHAQKARAGHAHDVLRNHIGHVLELFAGQAVLLKLVKRQILQLSGAGVHLVRGKVGFHALENVFGNAALLQAAGQTPCALERPDGGLAGNVPARVTAALERGKVEVHGEHGVAFRIRARRALQVLPDRASHIVVMAGCAVYIV